MRIFRNREMNFKIVLLIGTAIMLLFASTDLVNIQLYGALVVGILIGALAGSIVIGALGGLVSTIVGIAVGNSAVGLYYGGPRGMVVGLFMGAALGTRCAVVGLVGGIIGAAIRKLLF